MPNQLEEQLRAVQTSIAHLKKEMETCEDEKKVYELSKKMEEYYEDEYYLLEQLLKV